MNGLKKTLSIMLCVAMIASGSFMAFAEGESNPQTVTVVEGENAGENVGGEEGGNEGNEGENVDENKEENKDEDKQQSEALLAAIGALNNLPLFDSLTEDTDADALLGTGAGSQSSLRRADRRGKTAGRGSKAQQPAGFGILL